MFLKNVGSHVQTTRRHNPEDRKWLCVGGRGYTRNNGHVFDLHTGINRPLRFIRKASPSGTGARNARGHFDPPYFFMVLCLLTATPLSLMLTSSSLRSQHTLVNAGIRFSETAGSLNPRWMNLILYAINGDTGTRQWKVKTK
jgi:hypothetical protein